MPTVTKQSRDGRATTSSVLDRIQPIGFDDDGLKVLLYGKSGSGKTTLWSTFPGPVLAMVCSGGKRPGELRSIDTAENRKKIKQVVLKSTDEVKTVLGHAASGGTYNTLVLDHASGLQDLTLKEILGLDELPAQKGWGLASQQQYGQSALMCKELFREMLSLPFNVVIVAQERVFGDGDDSDVITPTVGAALSPSVTGWLGPACDYVVQTYLRAMVEKVKTKVGGKERVIERKGKGVEYCLRVGPHEVYQTKFRIPRGVRLPEMIVDPSYEKIVGLIRG
jgi:hypothetical protein